LTSQYYKQICTRACTRTCS